MIPTALADRVDAALLAAATVTCPCCHRTSPDVLSGWWYCTRCGYEAGEALAKAALHEAITRVASPQGQP
jgi:ribosomal protein L37AE/L43A